MNMVFQQAVKQHSGTLYRLSFSYCGGGCEDRHGHGRPPVPLYDRGTFHQTAPVYGHRKPRRVSCPGVKPQKEGHRTEAFRFYGLFICPDL